jgi:hypothetical protein
MNEPFLPCMTLELRRIEFEEQRRQVSSPEFWAPYGLARDSALAQLLTRWIKAGEEDSWQFIANNVLRALSEDLVRVGGSDNRR